METLTNSSFKKSNTTSSVCKSSIGSSKSVSRPNGISFGERLYRKSIAIKEVKETKSKNVKLKDELEFRKRCSFKPKINSESLSIALKTNYETNGFQTTPNRISMLLTEGNFGSSNGESQSSSPKKKKKVIESFIKKKEEEELKELKPSVKKTKKEIEDITNKLYREAEIKKVLREHEERNYYTQTCTFTPKITSHSSESKPKLENFFNRLQIWIEKRNENYMRDLENAFRDSKTGQTLFRPLVRRTNSTVDPQMAQPRNIFIDLYEETKKFNQNKIENDQKYEEELRFLATASKATQQIEEIHIQSKIETFQTLFRILDFTNEGVLKFSPEFQQNLHSCLPLEIRLIIEPLINELSIHNEFLNFDEFMIAIEHLYRVVNVDEKRKMINWYVETFKRENSPRKKRANSMNKNSDFVFKPSISQSSQKIYQNSEKINKNFTQRNIEFVQKKEIFINNMKIQKVETEIKECTFRPNINRKNFNENDY